MDYARYKPRGINQELLVILIIAAFVFGAKKLPEIGKGLGKGIMEFKKGLSELEEEEKSEKPKETNENLENKKG